MDIIKVFGSNVKAYRQRIGLSQEAFAEKCGMHRTYISAIECFRRSITIFYKGIMPSEKILDLPVDCNTLTGCVNL